MKKTKMPNFAQAAFDSLMESYMMTHTKVQVHEQANRSHQSACGAEHAVRARDPLKNVFFRRTLIYRMLPDSRVRNVPGSGA